MTLRELSRSEVRRRLQRHRLCLRTGPFVVSLRTPIARLADTIGDLYADFPFVEDCQFADFHIEVAPRRGWRRVVRPQAIFTAGGYFRPDPFRLPLAGAFFEWGLNSCISRSAHHYLVLHGAVVERQGRAVAFLGDSGSGKSTLCAALVVAGWRLLSDELALIVPASTTVVPVPRPISLKNDSIGVVRALAPDAAFGPAVRTARKGQIAHMRPPRDSIERMNEPARLSRFVFVRYEAGADLSCQHVPPGTALTNIARQSFNYGLRGRQGFDHLSALVDQCPTTTLTYGGLHDAVIAIEHDDFPARG